MFASSFVCLKESDSIIEISQSLTSVLWFGDVDLDGIIMRMSNRAFNETKHFMLFAKRSCVSV